MHSSPLKFSEDEMVQDHTAYRVCTDLCSQQLLPSQCVYKASFSARSSGNPEGYLKYLQKTRNKSQHSLMGNTVRQVLLLDYLIEDTSPKLTYTKGTLLSLKPSVPSKPQLPLISLQDSWTIPQSHSTPPSKRRTGRRIRIQTSSGNFVNFKLKHKPPQRGTHNSIIHNNSTTTGSAANSASKRHAGSPFRASEESAPPRGGEHTSFLGARRRRICRRSYRAWRRECNTRRLQGEDSLLAAPPQSTKVSLKRSAIFRNTIEWQEHIERKQKPTRERLQTTPPLAYNYKLRLGSQNVQGMADTLKLKNLTLMMSEHRLGILILSETKSTSYYSYTSEQHLVILSGNNKDKHAGVGAIIHPTLRPFLADVVQVSNRIIHLTLNKKGGRVHVVGVYAPHSKHDHDTVRQPFWDSLEEYVGKIPQPEPVYIVGDFNVRFQAQHGNDHGVTGPFVYGKGKRYIDHSATSNRSLCVRSMNLLGMLEVASHKTPNPVHQITFRDKAAPPSDWSQFILDPLIMQQVYDFMMQRFDDSALAVSSNIRAFLDLPNPLPPVRTDPRPDPTRFQRLDHCFTRTQWLSSVNSCRSKLHTGYPSDHYLLVTEIQIKLAQRHNRPKYTPKIDFSKVDQTLRDSFNRSLRDSHANPNPSLDHSAKITFYTDGAGTKGKATKRTPAGWGWCAKQGSDWLQASGPVVTDNHHLKYLGAVVGSNNTGELSAIIEALLFALEHDYERVHVHTDSQWSLNMVTGKWRPKTNKQLVLLAQRLAYKSGMHTTFSWVKGHAGSEGNEVADTLAGEGRDSHTFSGGRSIPLPGRAPEIDHPAHTEEFQAYTAKLVQTAKQHLPLVQRTLRNPWITDETLRSLAAARAAQANGADNWKQLRNQAKRAARRDRVKWVHDQLLDDPSGTQSTVWNTVRRQRRGFQGRRTHLVVDGKPVPWTKTHEAFRDHLQHSQWKPTDISDHTAHKRKSRHPLRPTAPDEPFFTRADLISSIAKTKQRKAPGPDGLVNEIIQLLDADGEERLLAFYNHSWANAVIPSDWKHATVVSIYKGKGDDSNPGSYRPISLLNVTYKIYASMIQARLAQNLDDKLRPNQFGFRAARGTKHPLFILRRAMEWSTMTKTPLHFLFLDWKQAFDSLDHSAMLEALERFGLSRRMVDNIRAIYTSPTFETQGTGGSAKGAVCSGIRQGCPLSPYLFIIVLSVIFEDLEDTLRRQGIPSNTWSEGYPVADVEYADDTLLIARTIPQLQSHLSALEDIASEYGMSLNDIKTELLLKHDQPVTPPRFADGTLVPTSYTVKYLGSLINWQKPFEVAFRHRAALAEEAYKKLRLIWNSTLSQHKKIRIFQSTFVPVLVYGLDALTLTTPHIKKIDAYYIRFLRRVIGIKASFYSRIPNTDVYNLANRPKLPSQTLNDIQFKTMVEVFNAPRTEIFHSVVFCASHKDRILSQGRRRGMQFPYWIEFMSKQYFPDIFLAPDHPAFGPHWKYSLIAKELRNFFGQTPKRADSRAWP